MSNQIHSHEGFTQDISRDFFRSVYTYMFGALIVSGIVAFWVGTPEFFVKYFVTAEGGLSPIYYVVIFAPVGLGLLIQTLYRKMSLGILTALFVGFSALMGL